MSARLVTLAVLLALIPAGSAPAQSPTYGGGRLQTAALPKRYTPTVGVSLQPRGSQIALRFDTTLRCGRDVYDATGRRLVAFDGGAFSAAGASVGRVAGGRLAFEWTLSGTISGNEANGTLRITGVRRGAGRRRACSAKPTRPFTARVAAPPGGAPARPLPRGLYLGTSSYEIVDRLQAPVVIRASHDARKVSARWTIAAKCRRGPRRLLVNLTPPTRVRADGSLARSERFAVRYTDALVRYRTRFAGRFRADGASGTLRLRARVFSRSGKRVRTRCDSGTRTWNAGFADDTPTPITGPSIPPPPSRPAEPREPAIGVWSLRMISDAGDYIGQGRSWTHGPSTDTLRVWGSPTLVRLYLTNAEGWWDANVAAPPGARLTAGTTYEDAHRFPFNDGSPGFDLGGYGRGCNESTSRFTVDRIGFDPDGTLRTFQVTFEQHCEHAQPALRGTWTFNAA